METRALATGETIEVVEGVHLTRLVDDERTSMQHVRVEPGATVPEHSHGHEQTGYIVNGTLTFIVGGEELVVGPAEGFVIPGGEPHAAENRGTESVVGIDVFSPPRTDPDWAE